MARTATRDVELAGAPIRQGQELLLLYPSANRDEAVFDDPDAFDITRSPNPHLAFGFGAHFCLGNQLARLEMRVMVERLLARLPDLHLAVERATLPRRAANFISGIEEMPVELHSVGAPGHRPRLMADPDRAAGIAGWSILVTGGGSGIGLATAERLAADGAHVTICGRTEQKLADAAARITSVARTAPSAALRRGRRDRRGTGRRRGGGRRRGHRSHRRPLRLRGRVPAPRARC